MANSDGASEGLEHAGAGAIEATGFEDDEGDQRRQQQPGLRLHRARGRAAIVAFDNADGEVHYTR